MKNLWLPQSKPLHSRRNFIAAAGASVLVLGTNSLAAGYWQEKGNFAQHLALATPRMAEGPFYPDKLPLDTDNDLLIINDSITPAVGEITYLSGRVLGTGGKPIRNARVEIWQVDNNGIYIHSQGGDRQKLDSNFQGFGRFITGVDGRYYFRTIKPKPYPGRTPHIHLAVFINNKKLLTTQLLTKGEPQNQRDRLFLRLANEQQRDMLLLDYRPLEGSKIGELTAHFDVHLNATPNELQMKG